jgi:hypothetical protein
MVIYIHELITLWYLNKTNDGLCIQEKCYSMVKDNVDDVLHVKSIHMKTKEDGKNDDEESW